MPSVRRFAFTLSTRARTMGAALRDGPRSSVNMNLDRAVLRARAAGAQLGAKQILADVAEAQPDRAQPRAGFASQIGVLHDVATCPPRSNGWIVVRLASASRSIVTASVGYDAPRLAASRRSCTGTRCGTGPRHRAVLDRVRSSFLRTVECFASSCRIGVVAQAGGRSRSPGAASPGRDLAALLRDTRDGRRRRVHDHERRSPPSISSDRRLGRAR